VRRMIFWIDIKSDSVEQVREKLKEFLARIGLRYKIVETCELIEPGDKE